MLKKGIKELKSTRVLKSSKRKNNDQWKTLSDIPFTVARVIGRLPILH